MKGDNAEVSQAETEFELTCRALFYDRNIAASFDDLRKKIMFLMPLVISNEPEKGVLYCTITSASTTECNISALLWIKT